MAHATGTAPSRERCARSILADFGLRAAGLLAVASSLLLLGGCAMAVEGHDDDGAVGDRGGDAVTARDAQTDEVASEAGPLDGDASQDAVVVDRGACVSLIPGDAPRCERSADCTGTGLACCSITDPPGNLCPGELGVRFCSHEAFGLNCEPPVGRDASADGG